MIYLDEKKKKKEKSDLFTRGFQYIYIVEKYETVIKLVV